MAYKHAAIWIDHQRARVVLFNREDSHNVKLESHAEQHIHHKHGSVGSGHAPEDRHFFEAITQATAGVDEVLVCGPAQAKLAYVKHVEAHQPALRSHILGVIDSDHPSDGQLLAEARKWFAAADRMRPGGGIRLP
ncbi:MAG TPA: translational machinery protein [Burkholderiales bacterium]|nr:translational machinery protein [Burkholderiales bacterium]